MNDKPDNLAQQPERLSLSRWSRRKLEAARAETTARDAPPEQLPGLDGVDPRATSLEPQAEDQSRSGGLRERLRYRQPARGEVVGDPQWPLDPGDRPPGAVGALSPDPKAEAPGRRERGVADGRNRQLDPRLGSEAAVFCGVERTLDGVDVRGETNAPGERGRLLCRMQPRQAGHAWQR